MPRKGRNKPGASNVTIKSSKDAREGKKNKNASGDEKNDVGTSILPKSSLLVLLMAILICLCAKDYTDASPSPLHAASSTSKSTSVSTSESILSSDHSHEQLLTYGSIELLETLPHDDKAFTQGLTFFNGAIYEGTGIHGSSSLRKLHPTDMSQTLDARHLPDQYFGEGVTHFKDRDGNDRFLQLTWQEKIAFVYDANTLEQVHSFTYETFTGEGWGVTYDATRHEFIVSDGSDYLMVWDAETFQEKRRVQVRAYMSNDDSGNGIPIRYLNELELITARLRTTTNKGDNEEEHTRTTTAILANVWFQNYIIAIDPLSGAVLRLYDLSSLCPKVSNGEDVLNGISVAGDVDDSVVYVTGKLWQKVHKIRLI